MRVQPRRFSESPNQNTRGTWCVNAVLLRYVSAIQIYRFRQGQRTSDAQVLGKGGAVYILHDQAGFPIVLQEIIQGYNVGVVQARVDAGLVKKALDELGVLIRPAQHLQSRHPVDTGMDGTVDFSHPPHTQKLNESVMSDVCVKRQHTSPQARPWLRGRNG